MGKYFIKVLWVLVAGLWVLPKAIAQDVSIGVIAQQGSVNDDQWSIDASDCAILVTVCNNDGGTRTLPAYKIRPSVSVPAPSLRIEATQPGVPAGWTVLSNSGFQIRMSNGTDQIPAGECREFPLNVTPLAQTGGSESITSMIEFASGIAPGSAIGPSTLADQPANNTSESGFTITGPMPVTLIAFDARDENGEANLTWSTAEESNSSHFEVQHSNDARHWQVIGRVKSGNKSNAIRQYVFRHPEPSDGSNYYRLRMVDFDGSSAFSAIRSLFIDSGNSMLFPNPVSTELYIHEDQTAPVSSLTIISMDGRVLYEVPNVRKASIHVGQLANGAYLLRIKRQDGTEQTGKFVVVK